jgi:mRNA-degrading endonuclease toxin of MazEF toxin-antitoxin module
MLNKLIEQSSEKYRGFYSWNSLAISLDKLQLRLQFKEREIWSCHMGVNVGDEQMGVGDEFLRPVVIVRKFNNHVAWALPLTRKTKDNGYYFIFRFNERELVSAILSQLRLIDAQRLHHIIGLISKSDFTNIKERLKALLP